MYTDSVILVLTDYPFEISRSVVDPRSGLPSRSKWLPTIAELKSACEAELAPILRAKERERLLKEQLEARELPPTSKSEQQRISEGFAALKKTLTENLETNEKHRAELAAKTIAENNEDILQEYRSAGNRPVYVGNILVSPSLLKTLNRTQQEAWA